MLHNILFVMQMIWSVLLEIGEKYYGLYLVCILRISGLCNTDLFLCRVYLSSLITIQPFDLTAENKSSYDKEPTGWCIKLIFFDCV